ncbi:PXA domain-containing protein [Phakopsora pachyrhizi]|nr:PXA domain-containing protein [Phakopsora pachyrhizi]
MMRVLPTTTTGFSMTETARSQSELMSTKPHNSAVKMNTKNGTASPEESLIQARNNLLRSRADPSFMSAPRSAVALAVPFMVSLLVYGYRKIMGFLLWRVPMFLLGIITVVVAFNLGLPLILQKSSLHRSTRSSNSSRRRRRELHQRLGLYNSLDYSGLLEAKAAELETGWRKVALHSSIQQKTSEALDRVIFKVMRDFVWKWYADLITIPSPLSFETSSDSFQFDKCFDFEKYSNPSFPLAVERAIRHVLRSIFNRISRLDLLNLIIHKVLPILTAHIEAFRQAEYDLRGPRGSKNSLSKRYRQDLRARIYQAFFSSGDDEIDLLLARLHADVLRRRSEEAGTLKNPNKSDERMRSYAGLHPAVDVPTPNSQTSEHAHLRELFTKVLPLILPKLEGKSETVQVLLTEILTCSVVGPVIEILSDSDFWNRLVEERAGNVIREQRMVEQLRQVLNQQLSFLNSKATLRNDGGLSNFKENYESVPCKTSYSTNSSMNDFENVTHRNPQAVDSSLDVTSSISVASTAKDFEQLSKSIQRYNTLFDIRRLKNDIETQIRRTEVVLNGKNGLSDSTKRKDLTKFLERLQSVKETAEHRIIELGGSSGPVYSLSSPNELRTYSSSQNYPARSLEDFSNHRQVLQAILGDRESSALSYFTEFMDRRQRVSLVQFWLAADGLKNPLEEEILPKDADSSPMSQEKGVHISNKSVLFTLGSTTDDTESEQEVSAMRADFEAIAQINFATASATDLLGLRKSEVLSFLEFLSADLAERYKKSLPLPNAYISPQKPAYFVHSAKDARSLLFSMQHQVFELMLTQDFPAFAESGDLYLKATASLSLRKPALDHSTRLKGVTSIGSSLNLIDSKPSSNLFPNLSAFSDGLASPTENRESHSADPDSENTKQSLSVLSNFRHKDQENKFDRPPALKKMALGGASTRSASSTGMLPYQTPSNSTLSSMTLKRSFKGTNISPTILYSAWKPKSEGKAYHDIRTVAPPQVTLQAAFDERSPSERLTGTSQYSQIASHQIKLTSSSCDQNDMIFFSPRSQPTSGYSKQIGNSKNQSSTGLDFLITSYGGERAPLFKEDLAGNGFETVTFTSSSNLSKSSRGQRAGSSLLSASDGTSTELNDSHDFQAGRPTTSKLTMTSEAEMVLQEALSSIISTSDRGKYPNEGDIKGEFSDETTVLNDSECSNSLSLDLPVNHRSRPSSVSAPNSPRQRSIQRKGLFDDEDDDEDEEDDYPILGTDRQATPNLTDRARSRGLGRFPSNVNTWSLSPTPNGQSHLISPASNVSEADEQIMRLENELNLLSSLMRRAELTGNKLEVRLVCKSIESASKELSEIIYLKTRMIEQKEIEAGGFRGKLIPGRVRVAITGTSVGKTSTNLPPLASTSTQSLIFSSFSNNKVNRTNQNHLMGTAAGLLIGSNDQEFVLYSIEVHKLTEEDGTFGSGWIVMRRYSEFRQLHKTLKERFPISRQLDFPTKALGVGLGVSIGVSGNQTLIDQRKVALERYLKALIQIPVLCESPELSKFLSRSKANLTYPGSESAKSLRRQIELFSGSALVKSIYKSIMPAGINSLEENPQCSTITAQTANSKFDTMISNLRHQALDFANGIGGLPIGKGTSSEQLNSFKMPTIFLDNQSGGTARDQPSMSSMGKTSSDDDYDDDREYEADPLASLSNKVNPIGGELVTSFTAPICDFLIELFELNDKNQWLRKQGIVIILQQILGGTIERNMRDTEAELIDDEHISQLVMAIEEILWLPDREGGQLRKSNEPRSFEEKIFTRDGAYRKLSAIIPDLAASILGRSNARMATRRIFSMCQNRRLNKHLIYTILDEVRSGHLFYFFIFFNIID